MLIKIKYISLVNLIADREVVKELIQQEMNPKSIIKFLKPLSENSAERTNLLNQYKTLKEKLGGGGASEVAAKAMLKTLENTLKN